MMVPLESKSNGVLPVNDSWTRFALPTRTPIHAFWDRMAISVSEILRPMNQFQLRRSTPTNRACSNVAPNREGVSYAVGSETSSVLGP